MRLLLILHTLITQILCQQWPPSENKRTENLDRRGNTEANIDYEMFSGSADASLAQTDPKEHFFRSFGDTELELDEKDLPKPGSLLFHRKHHILENRRKREVNQGSKIEIGDALGTGNLKLDVLNSSSYLSEPSEHSDEIQKDHMISINDFIRFKRDAPTHSKEKKQENQSFTSENRPKRDEGTMPEHSVENESSDSLSNREPRGLTRQEWVKFPYNLQRSDRPSGATLSSAGEPIKIPRVHFVTQERSEGPDNSFIYRNERQGRNSNLARDKNLDMDVGERENSFPPRALRREPLPLYPEARSDSRRDNFRRGYDFRNSVYDRRFSLDTPMPNFMANRRRRIIYYTDLPEVTRSPANFDFRNNYRYNTYYERFPLNTYERRNFGRPTLDEVDKNRSNSMKISTDVSVRKINKNPERRIYSEVERNYDYSPSSSTNGREIRH